MVIGRSEDRDTPWNPLVLRHHIPVWDPIRVTHLGQRSSDRTTQAGHMTATDRSHRSCNVLARRGPSTYGLPPRSTSTRGCWPTRLADFTAPSVSCLRW